MAHQRRISVIGFGYVGLPVAVAFARGCAPVVAYDIDADCIRELRAGIDRTQEVDAGELASANLPSRLDRTSKPVGVTFWRS